MRKCLLQATFCEVMTRVDVKYSLQSFLEETKVSNFLVIFIRNFDQFSNILDVKFHMCSYLL